MKKNYKTILLNVCCVMLALQIHAQTMVTFTASGTYTVPSNVISISKNPLSAVGDMFGKKKQKGTLQEEASASFEEKKMQLQQRISVVEQGLIRCGLRTAHLGSEEVIELFYKLFNPGETDKPIPLQ